MKAIFKKYLTEMETKILSSFSQTPGKQLSRLELFSLIKCTPYNTLLTIRIGSNIYNLSNL